MSRSGDYSQVGGLKYFGVPSPIMTSSISGTPYQHTRLSFSNNSSPVHKQRLAFQPHSIRHLQRPKSNLSRSMNSNIDRLF